VVIAPFLGGPKASRTGKIAAVHAIAITAWIEGFRRLPRLPEGERLPHFLGIGTGLVAGALGGTWVGYEAAGAVPPPFAALLLFLTPIYFMLSLIATSSRLGDWLAIVSGGVVGPVAFWLAPGFDLILSGLVGGTAAYLAARSWRALWSAADGEGSQ
jgi:hypothetical protein